MPKNAMGRILVDADAAKRYEAAADAYLEARKEHRRVQEYESKRRQFRRAYQEQLDIEKNIADQFATVDNIGLFKQSAHDFVGRSADAVGLIAGKNPLVGLGVTAVNQLNNQAAIATRSGLLQLIPGSTVPGGPGLVEGAVRDAGTAAGVLANTGQILDNLNVSPLAGPFGSVIGNAGTAADLVRNAQAHGLTNLLRTPPPLLGGLDGLSNDELRGLAQQIREGWDAGFLEELNGLSEERLASSLESYADAREKVSEAGAELRDADNPGTPYEDSKENLEQKEQEMREALAELEAWMMRGIDVRPNG